MAIIKHSYTRCYTVIDNTCLQDPTMTLKAKGLYAYLMSLPEDWVLHQTELKRHFKDGKDSIRTAMNELIEKGYVTKTVTRNELGQIVDCTYVVYDVLEHRPDTEEPIAENQTSVNPPIQSTNINKVLSNTNLSATAEPVEKPKRTRKPFTTFYEQILDICVKFNFIGMNDNAGQLASWFCKVALNEDGTVNYKGNVIRSYAGLVSVLRSIDVSGRRFAENKDKPISKCRSRSNINESYF